MTGNNFVILGVVVESAVIVEVVVVDIGEVVGNDDDEVDKLSLVATK